QFRKRATVSHSYSTELQSHKSYSRTRAQQSSNPFNSRECRWRNQHELLHQAGESLLLPLERGRLGLPGHADVVDGNSRQHHKQAEAGALRLGVQRHNQQPLTVNTMAGIGVLRFTLMYDRKAGSCFSLAPTKKILPDVNSRPFTAPKQDMDTARGITNANTPYADRRRQRLTARDLRTEIVKATERRIEQMQPRTRIPLQRAGEKDGGAEKMPICFVDCKRDKTERRLDCSAKSFIKDPVSSGSEKMTRAKSRSDPVSQVFRSLECPDSTVHPVFGLRTAPGVTFDGLADGPADGHATELPRCQQFVYLGSPRLPRSFPALVRICGVAAGLPGLPFVLLEQSCSPRPYLTARGRRCSRRWSRPSCSTTPRSGRTIPAGQARNRRFDDCLLADDGGVAFVRDLALRRALLSAIILSDCPLQLSLCTTMASRPVWLLFARHHHLQGKIRCQECPFCLSGVENAEHFICDCPAFTRERLIYLGSNLDLSDGFRPEILYQLVRYLRATGRATICGHRHHRISLRDTAAPPPARSAAPSPVVARIRPETTSQGAFQGLGANVVRTAGSVHGAGISQQAVDETPIRLGSDDLACQLESPMAQQFAGTGQDGAAIERRIDGVLVAAILKSARSRRIDLLFERICLGVVQQDGLDHRPEQRRPLAVRQGLGLQDSRHGTEGSTDKSTVTSQVLANVRYQTAKANARRNAHQLALSALDGRGQQGEIFSVAKHAEPPLWLTSTHASPQQKAVVVGRNSRPQHPVKHQIASHQNKPNLTTALIVLGAWALLLTPLLVAGESPIEDEVLEKRGSKDVITYFPCSYGGIPYPVTCGSGTGPRIFKSRNRFLVCVCLCPPGKTGPNCGSS
uniref:EGF-like domain-containing protein n=1 Tax=Macrostomum lignano TaxID=282301 RepID=A0A1I8HUJ2_9PLAT